MVSTTLADPSWGPVSVLDGYDPAAIQALKDTSDGDLHVSGSVTLVRAMLADSLVDELDLLVHPLAAGSGARLFPGGGPATTLTLVSAQAFDNGVVHLAHGAWEWPRS